MAELGASTVRTLGGGYALAAEGVVTAQAVLALLFNRKENDPLVKHLKAGGEIAADVVIPRRMMKEFEEECDKAGIPFDYLERDRMSEYVTVAYRDAKAHTVNEYGEFDKEGGKRNAIGGDREKITAIAERINHEYDARNARQYALTPEAFMKKNAIETKMPVTEIARLSETEMTVLQDQFQKDWIENTAVLKPDGTYSLFVKSEDAAAPSKFVPSKVQQSINAAKLTLADPRITRYLMAENRTNKNIIDAIYKEGHGFDGYVIAESLNTDPASFERFDRDDLTITIKDHTAIVSQNIGDETTSKVFSLMDKEGQDEVLSIVKHMRAKTFLEPVEAAKVLEARKAYFAVMNDPAMTVHQKALATSFRARGTEALAIDDLAEKLYAERDHGKTAREHAQVFSEGRAAEEALDKYQHDFFRSNKRMPTVEDMLLDPSVPNGERTALANAFAKKQAKDELIQALYDEVSPSVQAYSKEMEDLAKSITNDKKAFRKDYPSVDIDWSKSIDAYTVDSDRLLRQLGIDPANTPESVKSDAIATFTADYQAVRNKMDQRAELAAVGKVTADERGFINRVDAMKVAGESMDKVNPIVNLAYEDYCRAEILDPKLASSTLSVSDRLPNSDLLVNSVCKITDQKDLIASDREVYDQMQERLEAKDAYTHTSEAGLFSMDAGKKLDEHEQAVDKVKLWEEWSKDWKAVNPAAKTAAALRDFRDIDEEEEEEEQLDYGIDAGDEAYQDSDMDGITNSLDWADNTVVSDDEHEVDTPNDDRDKKDREEREDDLDITDDDEDHDIFDGE